METKSSRSSSKAKLLPIDKPTRQPKTRVWTTSARVENAVRSKAIAARKLSEQSTNNLHFYLEAANKAAIERTVQDIDYFKFAQVLQGKLTELELARTIFVSNFSDHADKKSRQFDSLEIDRANRLARIVELSERVFGNTEKSSRWLRKPRVKLSGQSPLELIATDAGAAVVEEMLHRIDHGMFA